MKQLVLILFTVISITSCNNASKKENVNNSKTEVISQKDNYDNFGVIKIEDKLAKNIGYNADSADVFFISLKDIGKYHGKVCPGIATGFKMIKDVLDSLYPNSIPQRGQIQVASSKPSDLFDVAGYITGARNFYGRGEINRGDLVIDTTLNPHQYMSFAMVFRRKDNGKMYKVIFHKANLIDKNQQEFIFSVDKKALLGEVDKETADKFKELVNAEVQRTLEKGVRPNAYEIQKVEDYNFPAK